MEKALQVNRKAPEAFANKAYIDLTHGRIADAERHLSDATEANGFNEVLGNLHIARGNYANASDELFNNNNSAALAQLMNKNYVAAEQTLKAIQQPNGLTYYLFAVLNARQGKNDAAATYLKDALQKDPSLAEYAKNDLEFAKVNR